MQLGVVAGALPLRGGPRADRQVERLVPDHLQAPAVRRRQDGNDSGWDNSTLLDPPRPIESPDLAALLVVQLDVLAGLGDDRADGRRRTRDELCAAPVAELWTGTDFVTCHADTGQPISARSLLRLMPILAADHLDPAITTTLTDAVRAHLTTHGLATEPPDSPAYEADGYWRGPVWAPSTVLIEHGRRVAGQVGLADEVSATFRRLCERSGFAENFDALTGQELRDRAYTGTAGCYLLLAREFVQRRATGAAA